MFLAFSKRRMSRVLLHCLDGPEAREIAIETAHKSDLRVRLPHENNIYAVEVFDKDVKAIDAFAEKCATVADLNDRVAYIYDHTHPKGNVGKIRHHLKKLRHDDISFKPRGAHEIKLNSASAGNTPPAVAKYYNFPPQVPQKQTFGVISLGGGILETDLSTFWSELALPSMPTFIPVSVDGASYTFDINDDAAFENTLDVEIIGGLCPNSTILLYSAPNSNRGYYDAINSAISGTQYRGVMYSPDKISTSWGMAELYYETTTLAAFEQLLSGAAAKGVFITAATGDSGSDDGVGDGQVHADFPATSPSVVACGGTSISGPLTSTSVETTWSWDPTQQWGGGGGISSYFPAPSYQSGVVTYPSNTPANLHGKRCIPDISLLANPSNGWTILFGGQVYVNQIGGTSCAAPAMAGLAGRMGLKYASAPPSYLYKVAKTPQRTSCFKDITTGSDDDLKTPGFWSAGPGYDLCTGLGSVNGTNLLNALKPSTPAPAPPVQTPAPVSYWPFPWPRPSIEDHALHTEEHNLRAQLLQIREQRRQLRDKS